MSEYGSQFITIALVHLLAVASPGPDFAMVLRQSIAYGRRIGSYTACGIGTGILVHVGYCLVGIAMVLSQSATLFFITKMIGAGYLIYIGISALRAAPYGPLEFSCRAAGTMTFFAAFRRGVLTNALNPKATLFFLSLFTVIIDPATPLIIQTGYGIYMAVATAVWFAGIAFFFGRPAIRNRFLRLGHWVDRGMGIILIALGARLIFATLP
jgi:RhtB (resistance to homoserine/threonine) family protein